MAFAAPHSPVKNLILVGQQTLDWRDFEEIGHEMVRRASDIAVLVVSPSSVSTVVPEEKWRRPTLTVSFGDLGTFIPLRGRIFENKSIPKLEQYSRFKAAGVNVPRTERFALGRRYDPAKWGEFVLLKPESLDLTSHGEGVHLIRTETLSRLRREDFPADSVARTAPMLIQPFIDTGKNPQKYRVLTLFGQALYAQHTVLQTERPDLAEPDSLLMSATVATAAGERLYYHGDYPEVVEFARAMARVFPEIPLLGCDILQDAGSGRLYALEINAGGNTWHFSSPMWRERREKYPEVARQMKEQFGAWARAAEALIAATRRYAR